VKKLLDRWTVEIDARKLGAETPSKAFPWGIGINRLSVLHG